MSFQDLKLIKPLTQALEQKGYLHPTPIQQQTIPIILSGRDVFGCAQTGTGKTAAFALPVLQQIHQKNEAAKASGKMDRTVKALILAPTRELALQISESVLAYGKKLQVSHTTIFGGVNQRPQVAALTRGVDILIATPGRLVDLMQQGYVKLDRVQHLILDEADRMLDMGFMNDLKKIISKLPTKRQTLFFSATVAPDIMKYANTLLTNPEHVSVTPVSSAAPLIRQSVYHVTKENKRQLLNHILSSGNIEHALVFTRTKHGADKVVKDLVKTGISAEAIHGNKSQSARERALKGFKNRTIRVLVATDIASRGIDVDKLSHVINYEIPEQAETYVHRIGRTGRAGTEGVALSFCAREERSYLNDIHKLIKKNIEVVAKHPFS
jgi:ATP-dependent RNA helicase RhlE